MESLRANYKDEEEEEDDEFNINNNNLINQTKPTTSIAIKQEEVANNSDEVSEDQLSVEDNQTQQPQSQQSPNSITPQESSNPIIAEDDEDEEEDDEQTPPTKKRKHLSSLAPPESNSFDSNAPKLKKSKKKKKPKTTNVWSKTSSRKGKKKTKPNTHQVVAEKSIMISPIPRILDRSDDSKEAKICLSKVYKAEKVELSDDRLTAGSIKGYRMVRATRGVVNGAWYFEIKIEKLGETGHTRLGWTTEKGDLQAPVGYDGNSYGYRDIDGSKIHKAIREKYGEEGYVEGDVIGFYINLPDGDLFAPKTPNYMWYKGHRYAYPAKEESNKVVPGSEISFFKNGVCQGVAFKDLFGGCYYPAASMYTLPNQPNCVVKFNFGPEFAYYPKDLGERPIPTPMIEVPYPAVDDIAENGEPTANAPLQNS